MPVYVVENEENKRLKIGYTGGSVLNRLSSLQTGSSARLEIVCLMHGGRDLEKKLHAEFSTFQIYGEWFSHRAKAGLLDIAKDDNIPVPKRRRAGRINLIEGEPTVKFLLRIPDSTDSALTEAARSLGILYNGEPSKGALARQIVTEWLDRRAAAK